jgi:hypothetical protein
MYGQFWCSVISTAAQTSLAAGVAANATSMVVASTTGIVTGTKLTITDSATGASDTVRVTGTPGGGVVNFARGLKNSYSPGAASFIVGAVLGSYLFNPTDPLHIRLLDVSGLTITTENVIQFGGLCLAEVSANPGTTQSNEFHCGLANISGPLTRLQLVSLANPYSERWRNGYDYGNPDNDFMANGYAALQFGATGQGVLDDSLAIQMALNYAAHAPTSPTGGVVTLREGSYILNESLVMPSGVTLRGAGLGASILKPGPGVIAITATNVNSFSIEDIQIQAPNNATSINVLQSSAATVYFVRLKNVSVVGVGPGQIGIHFRNTTLSSPMDRIILDNVSVDGSFGPMSPNQYGALFDSAGGPVQNIIVIGGLWQQLYNGVGANGAAPVFMINAWFHNNHAGSDTVGNITLVNSMGFNPGTPMIDVTPSTTYIRSQGAYPLATTNRTPGNVVAWIGKKAGGGASGFFEVDIEAGFRAWLMGLRTDNDGFAALYALPNTNAPTGANWVLACDGADTQLNAPNSSGHIGFNLLNIPQSTITQSGGFVFSPGPTGINYSAFAIKPVQAPPGGPQGQGSPSLTRAVGRTTNTMPATVFTTIVPSGSGFRARVEFAARRIAGTASTTSTGSVIVSGFNASHAITASENLVDAFNLGAGGSADTTPITATSLGDSLNIQVKSSTGNVTAWDLLVTLQVN